MLLNLPPELIQLVFQHANTPTYLQAAFSCRVLYEIASSCREVVLHHLHQTPGLNVDIEELNTQQLFQILVKRASRQLYGAQFRANCKRFTFGAQTVDTRASSFAFGDSSLAIVLKGQPNVHLFCAGKGELVPLSKLRIPGDEAGKVEVLKTTSDNEGGVYILQRFVPTISEDEAEHPFVKRSLQMYPNGCVYLVHYGPKYPDGYVRMCAFPDHVDFQPLAFAVANPHTFAISWQHAQEDNEHEVVLYTVLSDSGDDSSKVIEINYSSFVLLDGKRQRSDNEDALNARLAPSRFSSDRGPVINLAFNDRSSQLLYYYRALTLYGCFQRIDASSLPIQPKVYENYCIVPFSDSMSLRFSIAIPFYGTHEMRLENGHSRCHWQYLSLGIAKHRQENWTVACLLKSEASCRTQNCGHRLNLDRGRRFADWRIVARLWGFQDSTNSLGCIVAASKEGTRIAVANWNVLYVWALEPEELIEENVNGFYPPSAHSASSGMLELRPIVLQMDAVCFGLCFTQSEDELVAITDRGVMNWDFGPLGKGKRTVHQVTV